MMDSQLLKTTNQDNRSSFAEELTRSRDTAVNSGPPEGMPPVAAIVASSSTVPCLNQRNIGWSEVALNEPPPYSALTYASAPTPGPVLINAKNLPGGNPGLSYYMERITPENQPNGPRKYFLVTEIDDGRVTDEQLSRRRVVGCCLTLLAIAFIIGVLYVISLL